MGWKAPILIGAVALVAVISAAFSASSAEAAGNRYLVTYAARTCPSYTAITANRARNDIQESLRDLGPDTLYSDGQAISPALEEAGQPTCTPITDWPFTLGPDYITRGSIGPWGALSIIRNAFSTPINTLASTPLLDVTGAPTGRDLAGAVTVQLTDRQADLAASVQRLWVQGGIPSDPVMNQTYPNRYAFAALRCSIDNLNGDNVEWIAFPSGVTHVFCYAYYVTPPPTSGTIIVRKAVAGDDAYPNNFNFQGNISYDPAGRFSIDARPGVPGSDTFYRAQTTGDDTTWRFREIAQPNWDLESLSCVSASQQSQTTVDLAQGSVAVNLAAGDTVTCTYVDRFTPPPAGLSISKTTLGGVGRFDYELTRSGDRVAGASATTTTPGTPTAATPTISAAAGSYSLRETAPQSSSGRWNTVSVYCNGQRQEDPDDVRLRLVSGSGTACEFTNEFIPKGALKIRKTTLGGTGNTGFVITPKGTPGVSYMQNATTSRAGEAALATGDDTSDLPFGRYVIQETTTSDKSDGGWRLVGVTCDGDVTPFEQGRAEVELTRANPEVDCSFVNEFVPTGTVDAAGEVAVNPKTNISVTKRTRNPRPQLGRSVVYDITVRNTTAIDAQNVYATEQRQRNFVILSTRPSRISCKRRPIATCRIGTLKPGQSVKLSVRVLADRQGFFLNTVAVGTSTDETRLRDNMASDRIRVLPAGPFRPGGLG